MTHTTGTGERVITERVFHSMNGVHNVNSSGIVLLRVARIEFEAFDVIVVFVNELSFRMIFVESQIRFRRRLTTWK
jgi:hypothetical protein